MNNSSTTLVVGKVHKPLEVKEVTVNGAKKKVGNMTICAVKPAKGKDGKETAKPTYYEISEWNAERQEKLAALNKGDTVIVQGQLETQTYEKDGNYSVLLKLTNAEVTPLGASETQGVQKIVAVGRATRDVELEQTKDGKTHATIPMALNHSDGKTSYIEVETWGEQAEQMSKSVKKGSLISVSGEIELNNYTKGNGKNGASLKVVRPSVGFLDKSATAPKGDGSAAGAASSSGKGSGR